MASVSCGLFERLRRRFPNPKTLKEYREYEDYLNRKLARCNYKMQLDYLQGDYSYRTQMKAEKERKRLKIKAGKLEFKLRLVRSQIGKLDMEDVIKRNSAYSLKLRQSVNKQLDAEGGRFTPPKPQETVVLFPKEADRDRECESGPDDQLKDVKDKEEPEVVSSAPAEQEPQLQDQSKEEESGEAFESTYLKPEVELEL